MEGLYALSIDVIRLPTSTFSAPFPACSRCYCLTLYPLQVGVAGARKMKQAFSSQYTSSVSCTIFFRDN
jgi:hypothetical protein